MIKIQSEAYQQQYDHLKKRYSWAWLDEEDLPTNTAQELLDMINSYSNVSWPDNQLYDIYSSAMNNSSSSSSGAWYNSTSYGWYETSFLDQMINSKL